MRIKLTRFHLIELKQLKFERMLNETFIYNYLVFAKLLFKFKKLPRAVYRKHA